MILPSTPITSVGTDINGNFIPFIELPQLSSRKIAENIKSQRNHSSYLKNDLSSVYLFNVNDHSFKSSLYDHINNRREYDVWAYHQYNKNSSNDDFMKIKKRRADFLQTSTLQKVFERTAFPSIVLREDLDCQLSMSPRTVQIWFQNKR